MGNKLSLINSIIAIKQSKFGIIYMLLIIHKVIKLTTTNMVAIKFLLFSVFVAPSFHKYSC